MHDQTAPPGSESASRRSEARERLIVTLEDTLRTLSDAESIANTAARILAQHFHCDRALYLEVYADEDLCRVVSEYTPHCPSIAGTFRISDYGGDYFAALRAGKAYVEHDTTRTSLPPKERDSFAALQIGAFITSPLYKTGRLVALFIVHSVTPRRWRPDEMEDVSLVANRCWESLERARIARALAQTEERLTFAVEAADLGTFYCPMPLGTIVWNAKCNEHFWLPPDAHVDMDKFYSILHPDDRERTREAVERAVSRQEAYDIEYRTVAPDGRIRWVRAKGRGYFDAAGKATRFDGVTLDISEAKAAERQREESLARERAAREEAERVGRMKDEFLATLSHELRTPLNAILGWSSILRREPAPSNDLHEGLEIIERNARAQAQLVDDLLDVSRIISGKIRLNIERIPLADAVTAAVAAIRPSAEVKGVRVITVLDPYAGPVAADASRLQQVMWNLLTNAIKFTPRGGRIQVLLERVNSHLELSVADTGEGIAPDFLPHLFERFRQADASTTRRHGGLGLGLNIVKQLIELHGGTVRAKSPGLGLGSTFILTFPLAVATWDGLGLRPGDPPAPSSTPVDEPPLPDVAGLKILIVDDDADARRVIQRILGDSGASVTAAGSAAEALSLLTQVRPHVLISDIGMPGEDGYDLIRNVRALPRDSGGATPAVALTAFARSEDRQRALRAGFQFHLAKPVEPPELLTVCASLAHRNL